MISLDRFCTLGGAGSTIHLAHANGFPPGTYRPLVANLADWYRVIGLPLRPLWPGSSPKAAPGWRPLASDVVAALDASGLRDIVGLGHSIGGVLTMWAAAERPDLFRAVILVEPVLLSRSRLLSLGLLRILALEARLPLVQSALHRRRSWPSRQACFEDFRQKAFFGRWSDEALWAYVGAGTRPRAGQAEEGQAGRPVPRSRGGLAGGGQAGKPDPREVELVYPPEWEAHIFASTPLDVWSDVRRLEVPVLVVRGELSQVFAASSQGRFARLVPHARFATVAGAGHMVPMERPAETAAAVRAFLETLEACAVVA